LAVAIKHRDPRSTGNLKALAQCSGLTAVLWDFLDAETGPIAGGGGEFGGGGVAATVVNTDDLRGNCERREEVMQFGEEWSYVGGLVVEWDDHREFGRCGAHGYVTNFTQAIQVSLEKLAEGRLSGGRVQRDVRMSSAPPGVALRRHVNPAFPHIIQSIIDPNRVEGDLGIENFRA
jgi:hypothetical protein